jgi:hypothetical protein
MTLAESVISLYTVTILLIVLIVMFDSRLVEEEKLSDDSETNLDNSF